MIYRISTKYSYVSPQKYKKCNWCEQDIFIDLEFKHVNSLSNSKIINKVLTSYRCYFCSYLHATCITETYLKLYSVKYTLI